jgi:hypothetical protein
VVSLSSERQGSEKAGIPVGSSSPAKSPAISVATRTVVVAAGPVVAARERGRGVDEITRGKEERRGDREERNRTRASSDRPRFLHLSSWFSYFRIVHDNRAGNHGFIYRSIFGSVCRFTENLSVEFKNLKILK